MSVLSALNHKTCWHFLGAGNAWQQELMVVVDSGVGRTQGQLILDTVGRSAMKMMLVGMLLFLTGCTSMVVGLYYSWLLVAPGCENHSGYMLASNLFGYLGIFLFVAGIVFFFYGIRVINKKNRNIQR